MKNLIAYIDQNNSGGTNPPEANYCWFKVYAHGQFEVDYNYDIVLSNQDMPTAEGYYIATAENNKTVIINLVADEFGIINGRCCYVDDYEALEYVNSPQDWS